MYLEKQDGDVLILPTDTFDMRSRGGKALWMELAMIPKKEGGMGERHIAQKQAVAVCGHDPHISS
ncbi:hypothetical protein [uncultured Oscillibacter sp.]|uniref:hypothetical protein n=1 Tax=uncultured Oscillibacter sp. TaxID=876091 RepID=UPI0025DDD797|nr:hypothetical protein [uncultured Oscillibacter sp.]